LLELIVEMLHPEPSKRLSLSLAAVQARLRGLLTDLGD
jgi:hypothetical protein